LWWQTVGRTDKLWVQNMEFYEAFRKHAQMIKNTNLYTIVLVGKHGGRWIFVE
jgi:hypothetical protein